MAVFGVALLVGMIVYKIAQSGLWLARHVVSERLGIHPQMLTGQIRFWGQPCAEEE